MVVCYLYFSCCCFFFFKQKTAYEIRPRDWSSDVCSSDLSGRGSRLHHNRSPPSHRKIGTPSPLSSGIRFPGCSVRFTSFRCLDWFCSSYLLSTKKPTKKIRVRSSRPKNSPSLCPVFFSVVALLNLRLHRCCQVADLRV